MDTTDPYKKDKPKKEKTTNKEEKVQEDLTSQVDMDDDHWDDEEDEEEERESMDDGDDQYEESTPFFKTGKGVALIAGVVVVIAIVLFLVFGKKESPPPIAPSEPVEQIDPREVVRGELYKKGIGKDAIDEKNIYEQGPIESNDFRKDFLNNDVPENYVLPIDIVAVNDSVSYTKHRTMTDDGMDMYWVDAIYKSKNTRFTVPYYIWQTLAPQGVMDVIVEVVTDAEENTFVTSITAVAPSGGG